MADNAPEKRKRGRPKGSKNKPIQRLVVEKIPEEPKKSPQTARKNTPEAEKYISAPKKIGRPRNGRDKNTRIDPETGLSLKEEAFVAEYMINGGDGVDAYQKAFQPKNMSNGGIRSCVSRLLGDDNIKARIRHFRTKSKLIAEQKYEVTAERIIAEMARLAFARPTDYYKWGTKSVTIIRKKRDGTVTEQPAEMAYQEVKSSEELSEDQIAGVLGVEMTISKTGDPVLTVKLADRVRALKELAALTGHEPPKKVDVTGSIVFTYPEDEDL